MTSQQHFKALQLKARHQVYTLLSGRNLSRLHGEGYDLSELREYQPGDDVRKINWIITAKLGKPYVKELHANRELSVVVCALMSGSLYFGEGNAKQETIVQLASALGYAAYQNGDLFTGLGYTERKRIVTPPTKQLFAIESFSKQLFDQNVLNSTMAIDEVTKDIFSRIRQPSLIILLGDFLEEIDLSLLAQKHEIVAIIVREREEEHPRRLGEIILKDPQHAKEVSTYFGQRSIRRYLGRLKEHDDGLIAHFSRYDIRYTKILSNEEVIEKLVRLFS
jgi:uncharacterized protein (DUF58 family)